MSLKAFLFAVEALGAQGGAGDPRFHVETPVESSHEALVERNAAAMAAFTGMMGGVQTKGGRRR